MFYKYVFILCKLQNLAIRVVVLVKVASSNDFIKCTPFMHIT